MNAAALLDVVKCDSLEEAGVVQPPAARRTLVTAPRPLQSVS